MDEQAWADEVTRAALEGDRAALTALFEQAVARWGRHEASQRWARVLSADDGEAVTG